MPEIDTIARQNLSRDMQRKGMSETEILQNLPGRLTKGIGAPGASIGYSGQSNIVTPHPVCWVAAQEIERLRKMLTDHNICPDREYIAPGGVRVNPPASKIEPDF